MKFYMLHLILFFQESGVEHTQEYNLVLNHVTFQYYDSETLALDDVSLELKSGQKMAIVGQTGQVNPRCFNC